MFATDRDLLVLEPRLFFDIAWTTQTLVSASGAELGPDGVTLTLAGASFDTLGIDTGHVALVQQAPLEVLSRTSATELSVSKLRPTTGSAPVPATPGSGLSLSIATFAPQIGLIHDQLLRMIGVEPGAPPAPGVAGEADITNPGDFRLAEALGALHLIYASAALLIGDRSTEWAKARMYRERFDAERRRLVAEIDLDADGVPDATRRPSAVQFRRA